MPGYPSDLIDLVKEDLAQREECLDYASIKRMAAEAPAGPPPTMRTS